MCATGLSGVVTNLSLLPGVSAHGRRWANRLQPRCAPQGSGAGGAGPVCRPRAGPPGGSGGDAPGGRPPGLRRAAGTAAGAVGIGEWHVPAVAAAVVVRIIRTPAPGELRPAVPPPPPPAPASGPRAAP